VDPHFEKKVGFWGGKEKKGGNKIRISRPWGEGNLALQKSILAATGGGTQNPVIIEDPVTMKIDPSA